jgi:hypothetical protein
MRFPRSFWGFPLRTKIDCVTRSNIAVTATLGKPYSYKQRKP